MSVRITEERFVTPMTCGRCEHTWNYSGKNPYVATCPYCRTKLSIKKHNRLQEAQSLETQGHIAASESPNGFDSNG
jgi:DNA-directed RNA polymerase subunit RPC12/RpoP